MTEQPRAEGPDEGTADPESPPESQPEHQPENQTETEARAGVQTGHDAVDRVLDSLEGLDERPVDDHVAVFERAHDELRRALSDAGEQG